MKSKEELKQYRQTILEKCGLCQVLTANQDTILRNSDDTSGMRAYGGSSWIDYWRAMTGIHDTQLQCSSCGKVIYVGFAPKVMENMYKATGDNADNHRAIGGHVWVVGSNRYAGGRYIAPLCPACNNKRGEEIVIRKGTKVCKALGTIIDDDHDGK